MRIPYYDLGHAIDRRGFAQASDEKIISTNNVMLALQDA